MGEVAVVRVPRLYAAVSRAQGRREAWAWGRDVCDRRVLMLCVVCQIVPEGEGVLCAPGQGVSEDWRWITRRRASDGASGHGRRQIATRRRASASISDWSAAAHLRPEDCKSCETERRARRRLEAMFRDRTVVQILPSHSSLSPMVVVEREVEGVWSPLRIPMSSDPNMHNQLKYPGRDYPTL